MTTYLSQALDDTDKDTFKNFFLTLYKNEYWSIVAMLMGSKCSTYSVSEFFATEKEFLQPEPQYEYGSMNLLSFLVDIDSYYENRIIQNEKYRKQTIYKASETLSKDDYKVFLMIMKQEFDNRLNNALIELFEAGEIPNDIKKYFLTGYKLRALKTANSGMFQNSSNSADIYIPTGELKTYLVYKNTVVRLNDKGKKIIESQLPVAFNKIKQAKMRMNGPSIILTDDSGIVGCATQNRCFLVAEKAPKIVTMTEHVFSMKLCEGLKNALVIGVADEIEGYVSFENNVLSKETKKVAKFSISVIPYYGYSASLISCEDVASNTYFIFAPTEKANKIGKNRVNFNVVSLFGHYFLTD